MQSHLSTQSLCKPGRGPLTAAKVHSQRPCSKGWLPQRTQRRQLHQQQLHKHSRGFLQLLAAVTADSNAAAGAAGTADVSDEAAAPVADTSDVAPVDVLRSRAVDSASAPAAEDGKASLKASGQAVTTPAAAPAAGAAAGAATEEEEQSGQFGELAEQAPQQQQQQQQAADSASAVDAGSSSIDSDSEDETVEVDGDYDEGSDADDSSAATTTTTTTSSSNSAVDGSRAATSKSRSGLKWQSPSNKQPRQASKAIADNATKAAEQAGKLSWRSSSNNVGLDADSAAADSSKQTDQADEGGEPQAAASRGLSEDGAATAAVSLADGCTLDTETTSSSSSKGKPSEIELNLQHLNRVIAPILCQFGMSQELVDHIREHVESGGALVRSGIKLSKICTQILLLNEPKLKLQYVQGFLTCYVAVAWFLEESSVPCKYTTRANGFGPDVDVSSDKVAVIPVSIVGNMIALLKKREPQFALHFNKTSTRQLFESCPWMLLTEHPGNDSLSNRITLDWSLLIYCASYRRISTLQHALCRAIDRHYISSSDGGSSTDRGAAAAGDDAAANKQQRDRDELLASTARNAVMSYMQGASRSGRARQMLKYGVPVRIKELVALTLKAKDSSLAPGISAALYKLLNDDKQLWLRLGNSKAASGWAKGGATAAMADSYWLFAVAKLLKEDPDLQYYANILLSSAAATAAMEGSATPPAMQSTAEDTTEVDPEEATARPAAAAAAAASVAEAQAKISAAKAAVTAQRPARSLTAAAAASATPPAAAAAAGGGTAGVQQLGGVDGQGGLLAGLSHIRTLPGLGPLQVVIITSSNSPSYSSMLSHLSTAPLIGLDTEGAILRRDKIPVLMALMVPAAAAAQNTAPQAPTGSICPDTVYIIDLAPTLLQQLRARKQQLHAFSSAGSSKELVAAALTAAADELLGPLRAVFDDPKHTIIVQDARQDLPPLSSLYGLTASSVIDTQLCYMLLEVARGAHKGAGSLQRKRLEFLLATYGLEHPNKMDIVQQMQSNLMLWLTAPRPLSDDLLSYVIADVRYLPALVLLMERDLTQLSPGSLIRELQPRLPKKLTGGVPNSTSTLRNLLTTQKTSQLSSWGGSDGIGSADTLLLPPPAAATAAAGSSEAGSGGVQGGGSTSSSWTEPSYDDTRVSNLVFLIGPPDFRSQLQQQQQQQKDLSRSLDPRCMYQLLVPQTAAAAAQKLAAAVHQPPQQDNLSTLAAMTAGSHVQPQQRREQQQQQQQQEEKEEDPGSSGDSDADVSNDSFAWEPDEATQGLLDLLPARLSQQLLPQLGKSAKQLMLQQQQQQEQHHQQQQQQGLSPSPGPDSSSSQPDHGSAATSDNSNSRLQLLMPQLQQLLIIAGKQSASYTIGYSGYAAASAARLGSGPGTLSITSNLMFSSRSAAAAGLQQPTSDSSTAVLHECVRHLALHEGLIHSGDIVQGCTATSTDPDHTAAECDLETLDSLFGRQGYCQPVGLLHTVVPLWGLSSSTAASSSTGDVMCHRELYGLHYFVERPEPGISNVIADKLAAAAPCADAYDAVSRLQQQQQQHRGSVLGTDSSSSSDGTGAAAFAQSDLSAWSFGLQPWRLEHSSSSQPAGSLLLVLGPPRSTQINLLRDAAAALSGPMFDLRSEVAVVDLGCVLGARGPGGSYLGSAPHFQVDRPTSQASAITAAWQLHRCRVIVVNQLSEQSLAAVEAALAAGASVIAAADGIASAADLAAAALQSSNGSGRSTEGSSNGVDARGADGQVQQQQRQEGLLPQLHQLLLRISGAVGGSSSTSSVAGRSKCSSMTVVECLPNYRWAIYSDWQDSMQRVQALSSSGAPANAAAAVKPTEMREFMSCSALAGAAAVIDGAGCYAPLQQQQQQQAQGLPDGSAPGHDTSSLWPGGGCDVVAVSRFVDYGSASGQLSADLLRVIRQLLHRSD